MKTKIFTLLAIAAIALASQNANAKIRRIGFTGPAVSGTDYSDLQTAHDSSSVGDTLLLFPGNWTGYFSKRLVVLGAGYFITGSGSNPNLQNITGAISAQIFLYAGCDSSIFRGIDGIGIYPLSDNIVSKIIINRCNGVVGFNNKTSDSWQITQCYLNNLSYNYSGGKATNLVVNNCYIAYLNFANMVASGLTGQFNNNIFAGYTNFSSGSFMLRNNIFIDANIGNDNHCVYQNNVSNAANIPTGNGDILSATTASIFVGYPNQSTYSNDGRYVLKAGSPAIGAGLGGVDCGMFGSSNPYKLSGMPPIPAFYKLTAPSNVTSGNPYTITFSVQSNN